MNVRRLAETIGAAGHSIDLVTYAVGADVPLPPTVRILRAGRLPFVVRVPIGPSLTKVVLDLGLLLRAARLLRSPADGYDVMQGFEEGAWIASLLSRLSGVPFVYDMDSDLEAQIGESTLFRPLLWLAQVIDRFALNRSTAVLTVCRALTERAQRIAPAKPVFQIEDAPNVVEFIDHDAGRRELASRFCLPDGPLIVYTGNLEPYQGVDLLVRAAPQVLGERPDAVFLIVGGATRRLRLLQDLSREIGAGDRVRFLGERPEPEMGLFLAGADLLVSPRSSGTNTPLKVYSYLMSGRPLVATDRPVHTQIISANEAVLAPPTPEGLAQAILGVLRDPASAARLAENARRLVATRYSPAAFADKARAFAVSLETLLKNGGG